MKKVLALILSLVLVCCSVSALAEEVFHGFGSCTAVSVKDATADAEGQVQVNTAMASVVFDANGVIASVNPDTRQTAIKMNNVGVVTTDVSVAFHTKVEKGDAYGMLATSEKVGISKECNEQIEGLEACWSERPLLISRPLSKARMRPCWLSLPSPWIPM